MLLFPSLIVSLRSRNHRFHRSGLGDGIAAIGEVTL
jgi:hypothetical protein